MDDLELMEVIEEKLAYKRQLGAARETELFGVFSQLLTDDELLALKYLYAYMPLNDMADYDGELFLAHVRHALHVRNTVPWGERIPDSLFFHFVLPYRVNNENIEAAGPLLFADIYPRVEHMSMYDAILETNHWCHEKANYAGNDIRTVSPLTLMRTALGRCGEQSTLAVAALRSIGIPARQVYTPRWAHCDSNHAWVEAWADGTWRFLGACEPDPVLDQGWFRQPARRAMLVHTRTAVNYPGPEEVTLARPWYSELNLLHNYAATGKLAISVVDENFDPAIAKVELQLYNQAELYTIVPMQTDEFGRLSVTLGLGDVFIWASGSCGWGQAKFRMEETKEVLIRLSSRMLSGTTQELDMVPPPELPDFEGKPVSDDMRTIHEARIKQEAAIRAAYEGTFLNEQDAASLAAECGLPAERVWSVLRPARGNSHEIAAFLREQTPAYGEWPLRLLEAMREKDMTDTFRPVLEDHLIHSLPLQGQWDDSTFASYILNPRVDFEMIASYRSFFRQKISSQDLSRYADDPQQLAAWIGGEFELIDDLTHYKGSATPAGSCKLMKGDRQSRDILFVAAARSCGIPARLEPSDKRPQFLSGGDWIDARFGSDNEAEPQDSSAKGTVSWIRDVDSGEQAAYFLNFSLARWENGVYRTLTYEFGKTDVFNEPFELQAGHYRLTTGVRLEDGTTLVRLHHFELAPAEHLEIPLVFRQAQKEISDLGAADLQAFPGLGGDAGILLAWLEPDREPSKHLLRELREMKDQWEASGVAIACLIGEEKWEASSGLLGDDSLPSTITFLKQTVTPNGIADKDGAEESAALPAVYAIDGNQRIRYRSYGYRLGISKLAFQALQQTPAEA
ncbi:transglutaminase-like domain-containing protein [Paenibacillus sp. D51F]